jgi:hypothetical protein
MSDAPPIESHCARCLLPNPDGEEGSVPIDWEVVTNSDGECVGVICEDCITPAKQQAMDELDMDMLRIPWGSESYASTLGDEWRRNPWPCGDCGTAPGDLHQPHCDMEECPVCQQQAIGCGCGDSRFA